MHVQESFYNEYEIIDEILSGNTDVYRILVNRYSAMVFHIVRGFEKDEGEVEDLAQQIFVNAYERLSSFNQNSKFSSWLYSVAANHCRDYVKNIRRLNIRFDDMEQGYLETALIYPAGPSQELETKELDQLLHQAIKQLKEEYSEPFLMKYRGGLDYDIISERLGVSVSALKVRVHRARKELKTIIEKQVGYYG
ncbi:MAG: sigma-70 family RNA polymerase sigma factor [Balneolales bacterium]